jgi:beta-lactamase regulating signal transducer with metallopeptidase domain
MDAFLLLLVTNAAVAFVLACVAFVVSRVVRRPALAHGLWLLALVKLLTPPLVPVPLVSLQPTRSFRAGFDAGAAPIVVSMGPAGGSAATAVPEAAPRARVPKAPPSFHPPAAQATPLRESPDRATVARRAITAAVAGGALGILFLGVRRYRRFGRLLEHAESAPAPLLARADELAAALGLRHTPRVKVVDASIPPLLWPQPAGPLLLLPRELLRELTLDERDALLVHELAHVRRRDHWVRVLELLATALFWWYPVTWWARAGLRRAEERCCDEWVLRVLPRATQAYASSLLKSLSFVSSSRAAVPVLGSGASPLYEVEARLKEILMSRPAPRLAPPLRIALLAASVLGLAVFPTLARDDERAPAAHPAVARTPAPPTTPAAAAPQSRPAAPAVAAPAPAARAATAPATPSPATPAATASAPATPAPAAARRAAAVDQARALELDAARHSFDERRRALQRQELELKRQEIELNARAEQDEARACAERMRAEGKPSEAAACERHAELAAKRMELDRHRIELEVARVELDAKQMAEELALRQELTRTVLQGGEAELLAKRRVELDRLRSAAALGHEDGALEAETRALEAEARAFESELQAHTVGQASREIARMLSEQLAALKAQAADMRARPEVEREMSKLEAALKALEADRPESATPKPQR